MDLEYAIPTYEWNALLHAALPSLLIAPLPGNGLFWGQKWLSAKNTSAVCGWSHGTARVCFGHGLLVFSSMLAPVRQSPTRSWFSCRLPTVGVDVMLGVVGLGRALTLDPAAGAWWPELSDRTTAATISAPAAAAAPTAQGHRVRRRGPGCMSWEYQWLACGPGYGG